MFIIRRCLRFLSSMVACIASSLASCALAVVEQLNLACIEKAAIEREAIASQKAANPAKASVKKSDHESNIARSFSSLMRDLNSRCMTTA